MRSYACSPQSGHLASFALPLPKLGYICIAIVYVVVTLEWWKADRLLHKLSNQTREKAGCIMWIGWFSRLVRRTKIGVSLSLSLSLSLSRPTTEPWRVVGFSVYRTVSLRPPLSFISTYRPTVLIAFGYAGTISPHENYRNSVMLGDYLLLRQKDGSGIGWHLLDGLVCIYYIYETSSEHISLVYHTCRTACPRGKYLQLTVPIRSSKYRRLNRRNWKWTRVMSNWENDVHFEWNEEVEKSSLRQTRMRRARELMRIRNNVWKGWTRSFGKLDYVPGMKNFQVGFIDITSILWRSDVQWLINTGGTYTVVDDDWKFHSIRLSIRSPQLIDLVTFVRNSRIHHDGEMQRRTKALTVL